MGYTHYWTFKKPKKGTIRKTEKKYQAAIVDCGKLIRAYYIANGGLSGYSAHAEPGKYDGILFNGKGDNAHEDFSLRATYKENLVTRGFVDGFNFCKTARKPYDEVVVACLLVLKHHLGDLIELNSDGYRDEWLQGQEIAQRFLKTREILTPSTIGVNLYAIANTK